ncbi:hypothetical protein BS50DRAFT_298758 [Corynespora cassiicola Philippines]|uniref:Methyltransferase type 11 domain-containing protein n=1 Tax=Corynespora cassiicola Philippines TaxID=1448308 RepID=A0A2T2NWZ9_CORCC|nr:hypothetical protein BS50DRAFT_298758 [Corynespora cassiicola Philippines]
MASYKSQFNPPRRTEEQSLYSQRAPTTRLPQRSVTPTATSSSQLPTPAHTKLQKKRPTRDEQVPPARAVTSQRATASKPSIAVRPRQGSTITTVPMTRPDPSMLASKTSRQSSSSRLPKLEVPATTRTPSLISGSSASTVDSPQSNVLRRKQSSIGVGSSRHRSQTREGSMSSQEERQTVREIPGGYKDPFSETVLGISLPPSSTILTRAEPEVEIPEISYYDLEVAPADILPLPAPHYALSTTPSTRYSESPGPFSISSTPTSMSSYSPGATFSSKTSRTKQSSPLQSRPPVTRHRTPDELNSRQQHGLPSVRESSTSSSSTSTVLAEAPKLKEKQSPGRLPAPPPTPPTQFSPSDSQTEFSPPEVVANKHRFPGQIQKAPVQAPPELAHLAIATPAVPRESRRPVRPSRDGTPEIPSRLRGPSPVIQSNMSSLPSSHKRTTSTESKTGVMPGGRARFGISAKPSSRNPSPNPSLTSGFTPASRAPTRGPTPEVQTNADKPRSKTLPSPAPPPTTSKTSRFGFFSRRTKTEPAPEVPKSEKKLHRRGPAAGTGHEGYGRYALRGRSGSSVSTSSMGRSPSAGTTTESLERTPSSRKSSVTSTTSTEMDNFFLDRLAPVVIRGAGSSTELSQSPEPMHSSSSLDVSSPRTEQLEKKTSHPARPVLDGKRPSLLPSAMSDPVRAGSPSKKMPIGLRRPSDSDDDTVKRSFLPSLAAKRASRTSRLVDGMPLSKVTSGSTMRRKASISGYISDDKEGKWLRSSKKDKAEKEKDGQKKPKKWNFFQRAHAVPRVDSPATEPASAANKTQASRSLAHYALMDSQSGIGLEDIEQLIEEADSAPETWPLDEDPGGEGGEGAEGALSDSEPERKERMPSMLLPPRPVLPPDFAPPGRPASPKVSLRADAQPQPKLTLDTTFHSRAPSATRPSAPPSLPDLTPVTDLSPASSPSRPLSPVEPTAAPQSTSAPAPAPAPSPAPTFTTNHAQSPSLPGPPPAIPPPRPSRLAQVGRIPQVVSRRNQDRRAPSQSFSRPFVADQSRPSEPPKTAFDPSPSATVTAGPAIEPFPVLQGLNALSHASAIATLSPTAEETNRQSEFFRFPPRKDSELSYSSSSGIWSFPPTSGTAVVPPPGAPQSDDEVWNEYDDLIDEVLSPVDSCTGQARDELFSQHPSLEPLPLRLKATRASSQTNLSDASASNPSLHLRRSRLLAVLHSAQTPTSPVSFSDFIQDYGERNLSVIDPVTGRLSLPASSCMSSGSGPQSRAGSVRSSLPASLTVSARQSKATLATKSDKDRESANANKYRDSRLMEIAEAQRDGLVSMANLRFGALMTSKWLSFGRVLFSPAHFELKDPKEDRVLVIDGLGKDWSYYCALTYSEATIYNLGPGPSSSATSNNETSEPWSTLRNHHHYSHPSLSASFPFPKGFFACVVLRFPPALPSSVHRSIISECKRVLRPGGHLEISVLDLDLVNMGNRARRAIRGLKVKMQVADEHVSLRNISDEIMAGLGRKGFTECNRCFVGVPVAGKLPGSENIDSPGGKKRKGSTSSSIGKATGSLSNAVKHPKPEVSFSDLLNAQSSSESTDDGITEMVARVGRWWYSRCYESLVLPEAGEPGAANSGNLLESSIWRDESLINECEKRGTSFRLLIGYAQKPEVGVRRTVSV